jgi:hypothetical protein
MPRLPLSFAAPLLVAFLTAGLATPAEAQYFGRNKVQYNTFDFEILMTENLDV